MTVDIGSLINLSSGASGGIGGLQPTSWDIAASNALPAGAQAGFMYQVSSSGGFVKWGWV